MRAFSLLVPAGLFVLGAACTCAPAVVDPGPKLADGGVSKCIEGAAALALSPSAPTFNAGGAAPAQKFTATATMKDGSTRDASGAVNWSAARPDGADPGNIGPDGAWTGAVGLGGTVAISATDGCLTATAEVTLTLDAVFNDPGPAVTGRFGGTAVTGDAAKAPAIVYPNTETRFPVNIYKVLFQWRKNGNDYFRITFQGPNAKATVYSDGAHPQCAAATPPAGCYESTLAAWQAIAYSNAGQVVTVTIDGVRSADSNVYRSASIQLAFSKRPVPGAIFYWSTTVAGIRRATVSDDAPEPYAVAKPVPTRLPYSGEVKCIACHTISRDGKKMIAATQAAGASSVFVYDVELQSPPTDYINAGVSQAGHEFGTLSPDNRRAVATNRGALAEYDVSGPGRSAPKVADLPLGGLKGTHPDWSPKGTELAFATGSGDGPAGAGIAVISYQGGAWGTIRQLAPASGKTNLFPSYSPDGEWVVYSRGSKGGHGDLTTQLTVIKADGSQGTSGVDLVKANRWVSNQVTLGQFENNQPTWAPPGDLYWVAFNSLRPYGVVYPSGGTQQIWVAAVDPTQLGSGQDPSFPAFRFSFQGLEENNHRAFWTLDVRVPDGGVFIETPGDAGTCLALGQACSQTAGASCCAPTFCDDNPDGGAGTVCQTFTIN